MEVSEIDQLISIIKNSDVVDLEIERNGVRVKIQRGVPFREVSAGRHSVVVESVVGAPAQQHIPQYNGHSFPPGSNVVGMPHVSAAPSTDHLRKVESPLVGTFYRRPSPDAAPFVKEGDVVKKGDTLCIIEAMKLMNEVESPCDGKIEKVLLSDGNVVEFGEVLFLVNPSV